MTEFFRTNERKNASKSIRSGGTKSGRTGGRIQDIEVGIIQFVLLSENRETDPVELNGYLGIIWMTLHQGWSYRRRRVSSKAFIDS